MLRHLNPVPAQPARVVVVGAGGFVGNAIAGRLERDGMAVLRLARRDIDLLAEGAGRRLAALLRADDVLIAVAAIAPCRTPEMLRDNVALAATLMRAAAGPLAQVVNIGSDAVYGDGPLPLTENSATAPGTLHGVMHLARETLFRGEVAAPLCLLRPSLLYGAADPHDGYGPNRFRRLANRREAIVLFGAGEERRDHVFIDDLAALAARVVRRRSAGVLNVATGAVASFADIARMVNGLAGSDVPIATTPRLGPMPHDGYRPFDIAACRAAFPDFAYTPLADGLAAAQRDAARAP